MEVIWRVIIQEGKGENGGKNAEIKKYKLVGTEQAGDVKNSIGNEEAKELMCVTHGCELRGAGNEGKNWDTYNSIINKKESAENVLQ